MTLDYALMTIGLATYLTAFTIGVTLILKTGQLIKRRKK